MKAVVIKEFHGRPDGEPLSRLIGVGEQITGDLARVAIEIGAAEVAMLSWEEAEDKKAVEPAKKGRKKA